MTTEAATHLNASKLPLPPGPKGHWFWGSLKERQSRPLQLYMDSRRDFGEVVSFRMGFGFQYTTVVLVSNPELIRVILQERTQKYFKGWAYDPLRMLLGSGLLTAEGSHWRQQRKLAQPAFHRASLQNLLKLMDESIQAAIPRFKNYAKTGETVDLYSEMMRLTLEIVSRTLFGSDASDQDVQVVSKNVSEALKLADDRILTLGGHLPEWLPTSLNRRTRATVQELNRLIYSLIGQRKKSLSSMPQGPARDLLGMLMDARDEETHQGMSEQALRDEVMTFYLAGHETTANALSWAWMLLSQHPSSRRELEKESEQALPPSPGIDEVMGLSQARAVLEESMRLYPPAWILARNCAEESELGGYRVPKNALLVVSPYVVHRDPKYWPNPEGFDPSRFLATDSQKTADRPKYAFMPFSGGPRVCIGQQFAMLEGMLVLHRLTHLFEFDLVPGAQIEPKAYITLRPMPGVPVKVREK